MKDFHIVIGRGGFRLNLSFKANNPVEGLDKLFKFVSGCAVLDAYTGNTKGGTEKLAGITSYPELVGRHIFSNLKPASINEAPELPGALAEPDSNTPDSAAVQTPDDRKALAQVRRQQREEDKAAASPPKRKKKADEADPPPANDSASFSPGDPGQTAAPGEAA
jgi:hypothetical protein